MKLFFIFIIVVIFNIIIVSYRRYLGHFGHFGVNLMVYSLLRWPNLQNALWPLLQKIYYKKFSNLAVNPKINK